MNAPLPRSIVVPGAILTNDKGRFRLVREIRTVAAWVDVYYAAAYQNTKGKMKATVPARARGDYCSLDSLLSWATREATPGERAAVMAVLKVTT